MGSAGEQFDEARELRKQVARLTHQLDQATAELSRRPRYSGGWDFVTPKRSASWWTGPTLEQIGDQILAITGPLIFPIMDDTTRASFNSATARVFRPLFDLVQVNSAGLKCPWCGAAHAEAERYFLHLRVEVVVELRRRERVTAQGEASSK